MHRFRKNNKWRFLLCCSNPTNDLTCFVYLLWLSSFYFLYLFLQMCWKKLKLPKRCLLIKHYEKKSSIKKWKMLYFKQTQESSLFSNNIIWLVCRMVTIFLPTQRTRLSGLPRYLERVRETYKKISRDTWIKVSAQNMSFCLNIFT